MENTFNNKAFENVETNVPAEKVNYKGEFRIIGEVVDPMVVGYVLMRETDFMLKMFSTQQVISLLQRGYTFVNAKLGKDGTIVNTELTSKTMNRLPKFDRNLRVVSGQGITIIGEIYSKSKLVGYRILDTNNQKQDILESELIVLATRVPLINAKVVKKNDKPFVASLKGEFTVIEKADVAKMKNAMDRKKKAQEHRNKAHADKLEELIKHAVLYAFGVYTTSYNAWDYKPSTFEYDHTCYSYYDWNRDIHILTKEILTAKRGYNLTAEDKALFKKLATSLPHLDYSGWKQTDKNTAPVQIKMTDALRAQQEYYILCLAQFVLTNEQKYKEILAQISSRYLKTTGGWQDYYRHSPQQLLKIDTRAGKLIRNQHASKYFKDLYLNITSQLKAVIPDDMAKKDKLKQKLELKERGRKPFNTTTFKSADDIAQLGLAITKQNDGLSYVTKENRLRKLFYIGKQFDSDTTYQRYLNLSTSLGDILSVTALHKIRTRYERDNDYLDGGLGNDSRVSRAIIYMDMLIIIAFIYGSKAMKKYVEDYESELTNLGVKIPSFEELSTTDYKLDDNLRIYYESGFNVFLSDGHTKHLEEPSEYREYRHCGYYYDIVHPLLQGDLASTINIIIDNKVDPKDVTANIGRLRFM